MGAPYVRRIPRLFKKIVTFDGTSGNGAVGTVAVGTVVGAVLITGGAVRCTTLLGSGAGATLSMGTAGATDALIAVTTATDIDANEFWQDATPELRVSPAIVNIAICGSIILTVAVDNVTSGVLEIEFYFLPLSDDGMLS